MEALKLSVKARRLKDGVPAGMWPFISGWRLNGLLKLTSDRLSLYEFDWCLNWSPQTPLVWRLTAPYPIVREHRPYGLEARLVRLSSLATLSS